MSGYLNYSKSNNAVLAEENNCYPAYKVAKMLNLPIDLIKNNIEPESWHHTSKLYKRTNFYCVEEVKEYFNSSEGLRKITEYQTIKINEKVYFNVDIELIVWSGSWKYPKADKMVFVSKKIKIRGKTVHIEMPDGTTKIKRLNANGLKIKINKEW